MNEERKQQYFGAMAPTYNLQTGNTTQDIFAKFLDRHPLEITSSSVIHDNASGPGTATQILVQHALAKNVSPTITATDYVPNMIETLTKMKTESAATNAAWNGVTAKVLDSADLSEFQDEYFTHSINNFSLFTISDPVRALSETRRTLKTGGTAAVLLWKLFAVENLFATAQDFIKGEGYAKANAVPVNGPQYMQEGVVAEQLVEAGFDESKMHTFVIEHVLQKEDMWKWEGMEQFLKNSMIAKASMRGFTEDEIERWPEAVEKAMEAEKERNGGIKFEGWVTVAVK